MNLTPNIQRNANNPSRRRVICIPGLNEGASKVSGALVAGAPLRKVFRGWERGAPQGRDDLARDLFPAQMAREPEPGGAGFIHVAHLGSACGEFFVEPLDAVRMRRDRAVGQHVATLLGEGDGLGVDIQADVFDDGCCGCWVHNGIAVAGLAA